MDEAKQLEQIARDTQTTDDALVALHEAGASAVSGIVSLAAARGMSLPDAKRALSLSPAWVAETRAADQLHDDLMDALDTLDDLDDDRDI